MENKKAAPVEWHSFCSLAVLKRLAQHLNYLGDHDQNERNQ
jgi:hypothetical protein